jgi:hypothetical protein
MASASQPVTYRDRTTQAATGHLARRLGIADAVIGLGSMIGRAAGQHAPPQVRGSCAPGLQIRRESFEGSNPSPATSREIGP